MKNSRRYGFLVRWLITLAIPFLLLAASVRLLLSHEFLRLEYQRPGFPADPYGFTAQDRLEYGMHAIDYLFQAGDNSSLATLQIERQNCWTTTADAAHCLLFTSNELRHLEDVKRIITAIFILAVICIMSLIAALLAAKSRPPLRRQVRAGLQRGACLTLAAIAMMAVVAAAAWDSAFDRFHEIFFAPGTWRFPFSDSLIRLYPEQLFIDASLVIGGFCAAGAIVILLLASHWERLQS